VALEYDWIRLAKGLSMGLEGRQEARRASQNLTSLQSFGGGHVSLAQGEAEYSPQRLPLTSVQDHLDCDLVGSHWRHDHESSVLPC
jgi:hypothetical protein